MRVTVRDWCSPGAAPLNAENLPSKSFNRMFGAFAIQTRLDVPGTGPLDGGIVTFRFRVTACRLKSTDRFVSVLAVLTEPARLFWSVGGVCPARL